MIGKLKQRLAKTRENLVKKLSDALRSHKEINQDLYDEMEEVLIGGDVGVEVAMDLIEEVRKQVRSQGIKKPDEIIQLLKDAMFRSFNEGKAPISSDATADFFKPEPKPFVIMVVGVNGTGKTTTIGKLASLYKQQSNKVLLSAADTFRAAASEQLEIWAQRAGVDIIRNQPGADPASIAFDSLQAAISRKLDVLIIDTAGRLHTKSNLMEELKKIYRVLGKINPAIPHETLLVLDATTGQNGLNQALQFTQAVNVTGIILTKLDGTAKGGIVLAISKQLGLPVKFIGVGEKVEDLEPFDRTEFVEALFQ
ncbi:MAG: signal recognition particle-docking protein FtsY [Candidatus Zhuqueibacterota bacterium]